MTHSTEQPQYWQYQVRASMAGQKPLSELLLSEKRTHKEAVEYCVNRWGDRFKPATLKPYDPLKISRIEDAKTNVLTPQERERRLVLAREQRERSAAKRLELKAKGERKLWEVTLYSGEKKRMTSHKRTQEAAIKSAESRYRQKVKSIEEYRELPA